MPYLSFRMNLFCPFRPLLPVPFLEKLSVWGRQQGRVDSTVEPGAKGVIPTYEFAGGGGHGTSASSIKQDGQVNLGNKPQGSLLALALCPWRGVGAL